MSKWPDFENSASGLTMSSAASCGTARYFTGVQGESGIKEKAVVT